MAITTNQNIKSLLKVYYRDGIESLMFRNSPVLKKLKKVRIGGKTYNFPAISGQGGAVAGDFTKAKALASTNTRSVEFAVESGQLFSVYGMNAKEVKASENLKFAFMKVAGARLFASAEAFRKTLALSLYGRGYGEICFSPTTALTQSTPVDITLPEYATMAIDEGSELVIKTSVSGGVSAIKATLTVNSINGETVNVTSDTTYTPSDTDVICLAGSMDSNGNPLLPVGLAGWLPAVAKRTTATWTSYIGTAFFGVTRNKASDRLAGAFYSEASSSAKKIDAVQALLRKCRTQGSQGDIIVMNDKDFLALSKEIESTNTYFTATGTKSKKDVVLGLNSIGASFSTNYIENIIDDPYCPEGMFFVLDSEAVELASLTNTEVTNDGVDGNNAGKQNPLAMNDNGKENEAYKLIIDDYINVQSGQASVDGPSADVSLMFFGSFVVTNPSVCGVGLFYDAKPVAVSA